MNGTIFTPVRSRTGGGTLRHIVEHTPDYAGSLYRTPTPPALCGASPGGWVAQPSQHLKECPRCLKVAARMDAEDAAHANREPTAAEIAEGET